MNKLLLGWLMFVSLAGASEWRTFSNCTLIATSGQDGDSFHVRAGNQELNLRLYFVDSPETSAVSDVDAKRVRDQARYFGMTNMARVVHFGREAAAFTERQLAQPFVVRTTFATAPGRSTVARVYGLVTTAAGEDLGTLLVANGLARNFGTRRALPDGTTAEEMEARLKDSELAAMLKRQGIWAETAPDMVAKLRAEQWREQDELREIRDATLGELQSLPGVGPVLAARIVTYRPCKTVGDLVRVPGISNKTLEKLQPLVTVE